MVSSLKLAAFAAAMGLVLGAPSPVAAQAPGPPAAPSSPNGAAPAEGTARPTELAPPPAPVAAKPADAAAPSELIDEDLSLTELLNMKVTLPTRIEQQADEAPAVVTVVSRQDIETYGARDVADVLRMVPGFEFGADVLGLVGVGQRGIWGHEGKVLVMINGVTYNALDYGNPNFFGTMPAAMIERVEIIRGPGSAVHGTFAQVAVINIVTREADGGKITANGGMMGDVPTWGVSAAASAQSKDVKLSLTAGRSSEILTTRPYRDFFGGASRTGRGKAPRDWYHLTADLVYKNVLKLHFVNTRFDFGDPDTLGVAQVDRPYAENSTNTIHGLYGSYTAALTEALSVEPSCELLMTTPSNSDTAPSPDNDFATPYIMLGRYRGELSAHYRVAAKGDVMVGGGLQRDTASHIGRSGEPGLELPDGSLRYKMHADSQFVYAQYVQTVAPFGVTLGGRYESTRFGDALAPRGGLVFNKDALSVKLLYGRAFRIPLLMQAYSRIANVAEGGVQPETSSTLETQISYSVTRNVKTRVNGFYTQVNNPITYIGSTNAYQNFGEISSVGAELELEARYERFGGLFNASYARPGPATSPEFTTTTGRNFMGLPPLKLVAGGYWAVHPFRFAPSLIVLSGRYGQSSASANGEEGLRGNTSFAPLLLVNLAITWRDVLPGVSLQLAGHNLFNAPYVLVQPYYGAHAPLPAQDRQVRLQLEVSL